MEKLLDFLNSGNSIVFIVALLFVVFIVIIAIISVVWSKRKERLKKKQAAENSEEIRDILSNSQKEENFENYYFEDPEKEPEIAWESDQAVFRLSDDAQDDIYDEYGTEKLYQYEYFDEEDSKSLHRMTKRETTPNHRITSIIMTPIMAKPRKPRPTKKDQIPERVKSSFDDDFIFDIDMASYPGSIILYKDFLGKYRLRFKASNGRTLAHSQGFDKRAQASEEAANIINIGKQAIVTDTTRFDYIPVIGLATYEVYFDADYRYRYKLVSSNGRVVLASQGFNLKRNCIRAIEAIRYVFDLYDYIDNSRQKEYSETDEFLRYLDGLKAGSAAKNEETSSCAF